MLTSFFLIVFEIKSLYAARAAQQRELAQILQQGAETHALLKEQREVRQEITDATAAGADPVGLKLRALNLADRVLSFLEKRLADFPSLPGPPFRPMIIYMGRGSPPHQYDLDTGRAFRAQFGENVDALYGEFVARSLHDDEWDRSYQRSRDQTADAGLTNRDVYAAINGLRALAAKLPDAST